MWAITNVFLVFGHEFGHWNKKEPQNQVSLVYEQPLIREEAPVSKYIDIRLFRVYSMIQARPTKRLKSDRRSWRPVLGE